MICIHNMYDSKNDFFKKKGNPVDNLKKIGFNKILFY